MLMTLKGRELTISIHAKRWTYSTTAPLQYQKYRIKSKVTIPFFSLSVTTYSIFCDLSVPFHYYFAQVSWQPGDKVSFEAKLLGSYYYFFL